MPKQNQSKTPKPMHSNIIHELPYEIPIEMSSEVRNICTIQADNPSNQSRLEILYMKQRRHGQETAVHKVR